MAIEVALSGGLGNQLFQYATGRALADRNGTDLILDGRKYGKLRKRQFELDHFKIRARVRPAAAGAALKWAGFRLKLPDVVDQRSTAFNPAILRLRDRSYLRGLFQCERYFADDASALRTDLKLRGLPSPEAAELRRVITTELSVSVHVRRGDYVGHSTLPTLGLDYYRDAAELLTQRLPAAPTFIAFSDDPAWTREHLRLPAPTRYVDLPDLPPAEHLTMMAQCRHHIIANSTFSWWGAWLNPLPDKVVIAPRLWSLDGSMEADTIVPEKWLTM